MKHLDHPFNLEILKLDRTILRNLRPVTKTDIMRSPGEKLGPIALIDEKTLTWEGINAISSNFHDDGLFSVEIFGRVGDDQRDRQFSYIDLKVAVFHPQLFKTLTSLRALYHDILAGRQYAIFDSTKKDFVLSNAVEGDTGYQFFVQHWAEIEIPQTGSRRREEAITLLNKYKERALTDKLLVLPAGLRDVRVSSNQRLETPPINDLYRRAISIAQTLFASNEKTTSPALNYSRYQLQIVFNEIYQLITSFLSGKQGFAQRRWARRSVFNGTLNVITSMDTSKRLLGDPQGPKTTDTLIGLYQVLKGALPVALHQLRHRYLPMAFGLEERSTQARLVDPTTREPIQVELPVQTKDQWTTLDGLESVINHYRDASHRHEPVLIEGHPLALIYKGPDQTFRVFQDIRELPAMRDPAHVHPISLVELLYLSGYSIWNTLKIIVTRYPVAGLGSTYPSDLYVKTTMVGERRVELGDDWQPLGDDAVAEEFPTKNPLAFVDSTVVSAVRLKGLVGDYDGDTTSNLIVYSNEAIEEINAALHSREAYVSPDGSLRTSVKIDNLSLVLANMTGDTPTITY